MIIIIIQCALYMKQSKIYKSYKKNTYLWCGSDMLVSPYCCKYAFN